MVNENDPAVMRQIVWHAEDVTARLQTEVRTAEVQTVRMTYRSRSQSSAKGHQLEQDHMRDEIPLRGPNTCTHARMQHAHACTCVHTHHNPSSSIQRCTSDSATRMRYQTSFSVTWTLLVPDTNRTIARFYMRNQLTHIFVRERS